jgi:hypothetical protein
MNGQSGDRESVGGCGGMTGRLAGGAGIPRDSLPWTVWAAGCGWTVCGCGDGECVRAGVSSSTGCDLEALGADGCRERRRESVEGLLEPRVVRTREISKRFDMVLDDAKGRDDE